MSETKHIPKEIAERIKDAADLLEISKEFLSIKKKGASHLATCPLCQAKDKMNISQVKQIWKCFACDEGGYGAVDFLMKTQDKSYVDTLTFLANHYKIEIEGIEVTEKVASKKPFRDLQLIASGIEKDEVKWNEKTGAGKVVERSRYESGSVNEQFNIISGDDMILNYLNLKGEAVHFTDKGKERRYYRVRRQNPELHKSKAGKAMKYQSPARSTSQLWLPNRIIAAYGTHQTFDTLYITEGEKKADKMTLHGLNTVGISGIHNLSFEGMTSQLEMLLKRCGVKNVIFVLDSDWQALSLKDEHVDYRPKTFASAVVRFRDYFYGYKNSGIELRIFFSYGKDVVLKGADDLLVREFLGKENELLEDFEHARIDREGKGTNVNVHEITLVSPQKIYEYWHLQNTQTFLDFHKESLKKRQEFVYNKQRWTWNEEAEGGAKFEMVDKILEYEKYWSIEKLDTRSGPKESLSFNYYNCLQFLRNRGFGLYDLGRNKFRMIRSEGKVIREIDHHRIQQYIKTFTEDLGEIGVLNMILKGGTQYLGPDKLSNMYYLQPEFSEPEKACQFLYFPKTYWKITAQGIEEHPLSELPKNIWADKIINFEPKLSKTPMATISRKMVDEESEGWSISTTDECKKTDIYRFLLATSNFTWRKKEVIQKGSTGRDEIVTRSDGGEVVTPQEVYDMQTHVVCKMLAAGYILHEYRNKAQMKAIVAMDGIETEVGRSMGGSGKSIFATMFEHLMPTVVIDGKKKNLTEDPHIYDAVDERTNILVFDDCRVNLDFEHFFSQITRGVEVNQKGLRRFNIPAPKFIFSTNHAIKGNDNSTMRRQYLLGFSDYFNAVRTPQDEFGRLMFNEWDYEEWNRFYNFMAVCIQTYLKFPDLNKFTIPTHDLEKRKLRQELGENFLEFAELYFGIDDNTNNFLEPQSYRNCAVEKRKVFSDYVEAYPNEKKYMDEKRIKEKVRLYCKYSGLIYNPCAGADGRVKIGKTEYVIVSDENFNANQYIKVG
jgi:DNA primase